MIPAADIGGAGALPTTSSLSSIRRESWRLPEPLSQQWMIFCALLFSLAPAWIPYSADMWSSEHYQYFPVLMAIVAYLFYSRHEALQERATKPIPWLVGTGFLCVAILALLAHLLYSGFVGIVATLIACWTMVYACYGSGGLRQVWTVLCLLVFAIPLPLNLDQLLVVKMQFWASQLAAQLLDGLGVMHFRQGVILVTEKSQFMTEEACSGIRSLFSSLTFVCVLSVMQHHHWARALFNLLQTIVWVILSNAVRVAVVVILADHVSDWFATGAGHELLGMLVFLLILMMVVSVDALVGLFLFRPLVVDHDLIHQSTATMLTNSSIPGPRSAGSSFAKTASATLPIARMAWTAMFILVGLIGSWVAIVHTGVFKRGLGAVAMSDMPPPAEDDLPILLGNGWQRSKFELISREVGPLQAEKSYVYTYVRNNRGFVISVDLPWAAWHNLDVCYRALGWQSQPKYFVPRPQSGADASQSELILSKADKNGFVIFSVLDRQKKELSPGWRMASAGLKGVISGLAREAAANLGINTGTQLELIGLRLPATTIQMMVESAAPLTEPELEELRSLYDEARKRLLAGKRWN